MNEPKKRTPKPGAVIQIRPPKRDRKAERDRREQRDRDAREKIEAEALAKLEAAERERKAKEPAPKPARVALTSENAGVIEQVKLSLRSPLAFTVGLVLGFFVPFATYSVSHTEIDWSRRLWQQPAAYFVLGGLIFSAATVYGWGQKAFLQRSKALGFVLLMEGTMITSHTKGLAIAALAYLCAINGVATACNLAGATWRPR
jgi:hypothetical protein